MAPVPAMATVRRSARLAAKSGIALPASMQGSALAPATSPSSSAGSEPMALPRATTPLAVSNTTAPTTGAHTAPADTLAPKPEVAGVESPVSLLAWAALPTAAHASASSESSGLAPAPAPAPLPTPSLPDAVPAPAVPAPAVPAPAVPATAPAPAPAPAAGFNLAGFALGDALDEVQEELGGFEGDFVGGLASAFGLGLGVADLDMTDADALEQAVFGVEDPMAHTGLPTPPSSPLHEF